MEGKWLQVLSRIKQFMRCGAKINRPPDLATSPLVDPRGSRPRLAILAFRARRYGSHPQTKTSLRASSPAAHKAVYALWAKN